ncbi:hypothetical protein [Micromonospora sp. IBHARD004]|uniref:hypothetical protein n=1 Tax=Micromonospora sp. IBHARD004 TaxID=3457764 RepID=UPI00405900E9
MASQVIVKPLLHAEVSDVVQIDACRVGGVNEIAAACCSPLPATYRSAHQPAGVGLRRRIEGLRDLSSTRW